MTGSKNPLFDLYLDFWLNINKLITKIHKATISINISFSREPCYNPSLLRKHRLKSLRGFLFLGGGDWRVYYFSFSLVVRVREACKSFKDMMKKKVGRNHMWAYSISLRKIWSIWATKLWTCIAALMAFKLNKYKMKPKKSST